MSLDKLVEKLKGGPGSGHRGHSGRPGKRGGGAPGSGGSSLDNVSQRNATTVGTSAGDYVRGGERGLRKIPVGTRLQLDDGDVLKVDRSNGYVISGTNAQNRFISVDLRNADAKILDDVRSLGTQATLS